MSTNTKLADALRRCEQVIREACEEDPGKWDWAAINADEGAQAREALAAHEQAQAERVGLTDAEIEEILHGEIALNPGDGCAGRFARAIELAHGIGMVGPNDRS